MKKILQRVGAAGLATATLVAGLSLGPAAVAAPAPDPTPDLDASISEAAPLAATAPFVTYYNGSYKGYGFRATDKAMAPKYTGPSWAQAAAVADKAWTLPVVGEISQIRHQDGDCLYVPTGGGIVRYAKCNAMPARTISRWGMRADGVVYAEGTDIKFSPHGTPLSTTSGEPTAFAGPHVGTGMQPLTVVTPSPVNGRRVFTGQGNPGAEVRVGSAKATVSGSGRTGSWSLDLPAYPVGGTYVFQQFVNVPGSGWQKYDERSVALSPPFVGQVDWVDVANRSARISGTAAPFAWVVIGNHGQAQAGADGRWSRQLTGLPLGSSWLSLHERQNGITTRETSLTVTLPVSAVSASVSFPADRSREAVLSGRAQPWSWVVVRDAAGVEIARTQADFGPGTWSTPIPAPNAGGAYRVRVHQEIGGEANGEIGVTVAYGSAVRITSPVDGAAHGGGPVTLRGIGEAGAQVTVREQGRETVVGSATVPQNGQWTLTTTSLDDRRRVLEATQTGKGNNVTTSTVTLSPENDTVPADLTLTSHRDGDTFSTTAPTTLRGTATPGTTVTVYWFGKNYPDHARNTTAGPDGSYAFSRSLGGSNPYDIVITQTPQAGKVNEVSVRLVPVTVGPTDLTLTSHTDGDTFSSGITTLSGRATPGATVTAYWFGKNYPDLATRVTAGTDGSYALSRGLGGPNPYTIVLTQTPQPGKTNEISVLLNPVPTP